MQYLVQVSGNTLDRQIKTYTVNASSDVEAERIAAESFNMEYDIIDECILSKPYKRTRKAIMAFILMLVPLLLSIPTWYNGHEGISIAPSLLSCLYGVALYSSFVIRFKGIQRTVGSWIDIVFCVLVTLLLSTFVQLLLGSKTINLFWVKEITVDTAVLLPLTILLSWFGLKLVSVICMAGIGILALFNISTLSTAMGVVFGPIYIISAFMGLLFYLSVEPAMIESVAHLKKSIAKGINYSCNDFLQAKESVTKIASKNKTAKLSENSDSVNDVKVTK